MKKLSNHNPLRGLSGPAAAVEQRDPQLLTLRFPTELEEEYLVDYYRSSIGPIRASALLILFLVIAFGLREIGDPPGRERATQLLLRYGITAPALVAGLLCTYSPGFKRWMQAGIAAGVALLSLTVTAQLLFVRDPIVDLKVLVTLIIITLSVYSLAHLRLRFAAAAGWMMMGGYAVGLAQLPTGPGHRIVPDLLALLVANVLGMAAAHVTERHLRRDFLLTRAIDAERLKSERLLLNILPSAVADRLKAGATVIADSFPEATVLFADIKDFTPMSARMSPERLVGLLNDIFSTFDGLAEQHGLEKIKTTGDAYMVVGGLPTVRADHAEAVANLALDMQTAVAGFHADDGHAIALRIGIHTGPVVAGVIGARKFAYDLWGDTVNTASRMESQGLPNRIHVTEATYQRLKDKYVFERRGEIEVRGRGPMVSYFLCGRREQHELEQAVPDLAVVSDGKRQQPRITSG